MSHYNKKKRLQYKISIQFLYLEFIKKKLLFHHKLHAKFFIFPLILEAIPLKIIYKQASLLPINRFKLLSILGYLMFGNKIVDIITMGSA